MAEICDRCRCDRQFHRAGWCANCGRSGCAQFLAPPISIEEEPLALTPGAAELAEVDVAVLEELKQRFLTASATGRITVLPYSDPPPLESFNAWRCYICGMRSYRQETCCRLMDPVRVEIHSREVIGGH